MYSLTETGGKYKLVLCEAAYFNFWFLWPVFFCFGSDTISGIMSLSLTIEMSTPPLLLALRWWLLFVLDYSVEAPAVMEPTYSEMRYLAPLMGRVELESPLGRELALTEVVLGGLGASDWIVLGSIPVSSWIPLRRSAELNLLSVMLIPELVNRGEVRMLLTPLQLLLPILFTLFRCLLSIAITFSFNLGSSPMNMLFFNLFSSFVLFLSFAMLSSILEYSSD